MISPAKLDKLPAEVVNLVQALQEEMPQGIESKFPYTYCRVGAV